MKRMAFAIVLLTASVAIAQPSASQPSKASASAPAKVVALTPSPVMPAAATQPLGKVAGVDDMTGVTGTLTKAIDSKNWHVVVAAVLLFLIWVLRAIGSKFWKFIGTDRGGALLALISGLLVVFINGWAGGGKFSITWLIQGIELGVTAAGGWVVAKRLIVPTDKKEEKAAAAAVAAQPDPPTT